MGSAVSRRRLWAGECCERDEPVNVRRIFALTFVAVLMLGACGIPVDDAPRELAIPEEEDPEATTTTTQAPDPADATRQFVYFIQDGLLHRLGRGIVGDSNQAVFDALLAGPTEAELEQGFETRLPDDFEVRVVLNDRVLTIDILSEGGIQFEGEGRILATAQLALTGIISTSASGVVFKVQGEFEQQLNGLGELQELDEAGEPIPLQFGDFSDLLGN